VKKFLVVLFVGLLVYGCGARYKQEHVYSTAATTVNIKRGNVEFAVFGDTRPPWNPIHKKILEQMQDYDIDFAVNTGDFTNWSSEHEYNEYLKIIKKSPIPIFTVIGNHDDRFWGKRHYERKIGRLAETMDLEDIALVFMYVNNGFSKLTLMRLEKTFKKSAGKDIFVFNHIPIREPFENHMKDGLFKIDEKLSNADRFMRLLEKYKIRGVFFGHEHLYAYSNINGIKYIITGGGGARLNGDSEVMPIFGSFHHFVLLRKYQGEYNVEVVRLK